MKRHYLYTVIVILLAGCQQHSRISSKGDWSLYEKAYALLPRHQDSAFYYFNQVTVQSRDSLQTAMAYSIMGQIQYRAGDYYGSQESLLTSLKYLTENKHEHYPYLAGDYNDLGLVRSELKDRNGALDFYAQAMRFNADSNLLNQILNNMAYELQQKKDYGEAIVLYRRLLNKFKLKNRDYARAQTNLAITQWLANPNFNAATPLRVALTVRKKTNDLWGQNSSYAHLADYYHQTQRDSALIFAKAMYQVSCQIKSPDDQLQALDKLVRLSPATEGSRYFEIFRRLNDSLQTARNAAKNQFALIRYNVEKSKVDNLKLQKKNAEKNFQLILVLTAILIGSLLAVWWYKKRKREQAAATLLAIEETNRKAAKKVHDTLANDIYVIMKNVQHDLVTDKDVLVAEIDDVYRRARDLSYDLASDQALPYKEQIEKLLKPFETDTTEVVKAGDLEEFGQKASLATKIQLRYVLQELMINMQKHSQATKVSLKFQDKTDYCLITYWDNGIGLPVNIYKGNGLKNTGNRIQELKGKFTFERISEGLQITMTIPYV